MKFLQVLQLFIYSSICGSLDFSIEVTDFYYTDPVKQKSVEFWCHIVSDPTQPKINVTIKWSKNDVLLHDGANSKEYSIENTESLESKLKIISIVPADIGRIYKCEAYSPGDVPQRLKSKVATLYVAPRVKVKHDGQVSQSVTITDGHPLTISCEVWGYPLATIEWTRTDGQVISAMNVTTSTSYNIMSELVWDKLVMEDRAYYACNATNEFNSTLHTDQTTVYVRIKSKLAILWPLLGILIEVILLVIIIGTYEYMKHKKQRKEQHGVSFDKNVDGESEAMIDTKSK